MSAPKTVTVLTPDMICIGPLTKGECGCLMHWRCVDYYLSSFAGAESCECDILRRLIGQAVTFEEDEAAGTFTTAQLAQARNRATAIMGYVVGNPEAKWAERHWREFEDILQRHGIKREA